MIATWIVALLALAVAAPIAVEQYLAERRAEHPAPHWPQRPHESAPPHPRVTPLRRPRAHDGGEHRHAA
jgi:hypothetical protein